MSGWNLALEIRRGNSAPRVAGPLERSLGQPRGGREAPAPCAPAPSASHPDVPGPPRSPAAPWRTCGRPDPFLRPVWGHHHRAMDSRRAGARRAARRAFTRGNAEPYPWSLCLRKFRPDRRAAQQPGRVLRARELRALVSRPVRAPRAQRRSGRLRRLLTPTSHCIRGPRAIRWRSAATWCNGPRCRERARTGRRSRPCAGA